MASSSSDRALKIRVGALILLAVAVAVAFVVTLGSFSLARAYPLYVDFDFSGNLQAGAPVKISGIKVGKVEEVAFWGGRYDEAEHRRVQVRMRLSVEEKARESIRQDAEFYINTQGVLGEQYLEIVPGRDYEHPPLGEGKVRVGVNPPRTDLIVSRLYDFLDSITSLLKDDKDVIRDFLQSGASMVRTLDAILKENHQEIARLIKNVDKLTAEASSVLDAVRRGIGDPASLRRTLANVEATSASIRKDIDPLISKTKRALDDVDSLASTVGPEEKKKLGRALDELVSLGGKVEGVTTDVQAIVADVRKGRGTAGAILVDPQIYDDLKELVRDLKRNPWKFFWKE